MKLFCLTKLDYLSKFSKLKKSQYWLQNKTLFQKVTYKYYIVKK